MFRHIILFTFKPSVSTESIAQLFKEIGALKQHIPGILGYSWGHNQWRDIASDYDYCFVMDFESKQARDNYQSHQKHLDVVEQWVDPAIEKATVFDYEPTCTLTEKEEGYVCR